MDAHASWRCTATAWPSCAAHYPISSTTGRLRDQWHGMSRTGTLARLFGQRT